VCSVGELKTREEACETGRRLTLSLFLSLFLDGGDGGCGDDDDDDDAGDVGT